MKIFFIIGFLLFSVCTYAQSDRLQPVHDYFTLSEHQRNYYSYVHKHLLKGFSTTPLVRVLSLGGFESVVFLEDLEGKESYKLTYRESKESIWYNEEKESIKTETFVTEIDPELAKLISDAFNQATFEVKFPEEPDWRPGHTIYFITIFTQANGIQTGKTSSPKEGTKMNLLIEITNKMKEMTRAKKEEKIFLKRQIAALSFQFTNK